MDKLRQNFSKIRVPSQTDKVFKDECMFSFDTPVRLHSLKPYGFKQTRHRLCPIANIYYMPNFNFVYHSLNQCTKRGQFFHAPKIYLKFCTPGP